MINPHQLSAQLLRQIYKHAAAALALHCAHVALLAVFLWRELTLSIFLAWLGIALTGGVWHWFAGRRSLSPVAEGGSMTPDVLAAGIAGLSLGLTASLFPYLPLTTRLFVILLLVEQLPPGLCRALGRCQTSTSPIYPGC